MPRSLKAKGSSCWEYREVAKRDGRREKKAIDWEVVITKNV